MAFYGKAGQRLTQKDLEQRARLRRASNARTAAIVQMETARAKQLWAAGLVRPYLITAALDAKGLYGPEVDEACGVEEPTVDLWEAGQVYPTWEQLCALAELCQARPWFFTREISHSGRAPMFMCGGRRVPEPVKPPVVYFDPLALAEAGLNPWPAGTPDGGMF